MIHALLIVGLGLALELIAAACVGGAIDEIRKSAHDRDGHHEFTAGLAIAFAIGCFIVVAGLWS